MRDQGDLMDELRIARFDASVAHTEKDAAIAAAIMDFRQALIAQLAEMELHDETGDERDLGYMAAITELRGWLWRP